MLGTAGLVVELAEAKVAVGHQWACAECLGTLYTTTGRGEHAGTELAAAIALYVAMTFWLSQTEATLAQVDTKDRRHP